MRAGIVVNVTRSDRRRLEAIVSDRSAAQKHVWRAKIILATADGCGTAEIMRRSGKSKPVVWRWQARFMAEGVEGLARDKTRKPGKPPLPPDTVRRVVDQALGPPPGEATHWTGRRLEEAREGDAGEGGRGEFAVSAAHPCGPPARPASHPDVQTVERSEVRREAQGHCRPLRRSPRPCRCPRVRQKEPNPGARPHPTRPADEAGPRRYNDARLQTPWHHD